MLNKKFKIGWLISFKKYSIKALKRPKQISLSGLISRATINRGVREFVSIS